MVFVNCKEVFIQVKIISSVKIIGLMSSIILKCLASHYKDTFVNRLNQTQ